MKPLIALTGLKEENGRYAVDCRYCDAILQAGGIPVLLPILKAENFDWDTLLSSIQGVLMTGGADIDPSHYGQALHPKTQVDALRDFFELPLAKELYRRNIPTLGICRGVQTMAVAMGGKLQQHIEGHSNGILHTVSVLAQAPTFLQSQSHRAIHSSHHQVIEALPSTARAIAYAADGSCIEAIDFPNRHFFVGVQWHPERILDESAQALFSAFLKAATEIQK